MFVSGAACTAACTSETWRGGSCCRCCRDRTTQPPPLLPLLVLLPLLPQQQGVVLVMPQQQAVGVGVVVAGQGSQMLGWSGGSLGAWVV
jgi:hypothetical protein